MNLSAFARWAVMNGPFQGCDLDGSQIQDEAVRYGIIEETVYDQEIHGDANCEVGDKYFVFTEDFKNALALDSLR